MKKHIDFNDLTRYNRHLLLDMQYLPRSNIRYNKGLKEWCYYFEIPVGRGGDIVYMQVLKDTLSKYRINHLVAGGALFPIKDKYKPNKIYKYILNRNYKVE